MRKLRLAIRIKILSRSKRWKAVSVEFLSRCSTEAIETKEASIVLRKYISGEKVSKYEMKIVKSQLKDVAKIVGIGIPFFLIPGASLLLPILIKVSSHYNIELLPSAFFKEYGNTEGKTSSKH